MTEEEIDFYKFMVACWVKQNSHPFLGTQPIRADEAKVFILKTNYEKLESDDAFFQEGEVSSEGSDILSKIAMKIDGYTVKDRADSLEEIEKFYLGIFDEKVPTQLSNLDDAKFELMRLSSQIAKETRRGRGNVLICHPSDYSRVESIGGNVVTGVKIVTREYVTPGSGYIVYKGSHEMDCPAVWSYRPTHDEHHYVIDDALAQTYGHKFYLPTQEK